MYYMYLISFIGSLAVWIHSIYRIWKYKDDMVKMWIALAFVWISNLGMIVCR